MLDEPTAALGVPQTKQVLALIKRLRVRELGVIVVSHNLANVFEVCDRIFNSDRGLPLAALILLALDSSVKFMVTGGVLLAAVVADALARMRRQAEGRV